MKTGQKEICKNCGQEIAPNEGGCLDCAKLSASFELMIRKDISKPRIVASNKPKARK